MKLIIKTLSPSALVPTYGSEYAAGLDLYADSEHVVQPNSRVCVSTGIAVEWVKNNENDERPEDFYLRIAPRSGLSFKYGIDVLAGVIDVDYRGEIKVILLNSGDKEFIISKGDRVAQAILTRIIRFSKIEQVDTLSGTQRGEGGFGSTGTK